VYDEYRVAVRSEPLLWVRGTLQRDGGPGGSVNVIAERLEGLHIGKRGPGSGSTGNATGDVPRGAPYEFLRAMRGVAPGSKDWG
jgi:hypothetical protein